MFGTESFYCSYTKHFDSTLNNNCTCIFSEYNCTDEDVSLCQELAANGYCDVYADLCRDSCHPDCARKLRFKHK